MGHIYARIDLFLIHSLLLSLLIKISSQIIPCGSLDHHPISLYFTKEVNLGHIPFRINPLWLENQYFSPLVSHTWCEWVVGSPFYIWEKNLKSNKEAIKDWVKNSPSSP
jgi:hypothetical protein